MIIKCRAEIFSFHTRVFDINLLSFWEIINIAYVYLPREQLVLEFVVLSRHLMEIQTGIQLSETRYTLVSFLVLSAYIPKHVMVSAL